MSVVSSCIFSVASVLRIQSWWRMMQVRMKYMEYLAERKEMKRTYYRSWKIYWRSERMFSVGHLLPTTIDKCI
ncbi:hypothetical protein EON65_31860 [archaeon]|nr:MAG: hypothetical protein EON65_31860 [archaeon]